MLGDQKLECELTIKAGQGGEGSQRPVTAHVD